MKTCTIHIDDEIGCRIDGLRPEDRDVLWEKFGFFVDGFQHMPAYQLRRWDGKIRFFEKTGATYTKLLEEILPYVCSWNYDVNTVDKRLPTPLIEQRVDADLFGMSSFHLRPYQTDVINALLEAGSGLAICATGSGKTPMCAALALILYLNKIQTIVIVPSSDLVSQTAAEFREKLEIYSEYLTVGEYSGSGKDIDHPLVVATWQSLQNAPHYMKDFQALIVDECFDGRSKVLTMSGYRAIETINEGDKIVSYNSQTYNFEVDEVVKLHKNLQKSNNENMYRLEFDNNVILEVTGNHEFLTERGLIRVDELTCDDILINTESHGGKAVWLRDLVGEQQLKS